MVLKGCIQNLFTLKRKREKVMMRWNIDEDSSERPLENVMESIVKCGL